MSPKRSQKDGAEKKDHYTAVPLEEVRYWCRVVIDRLECVENSLKAAMKRDTVELKLGIRGINVAVIRHDGDIAALMKTA